ncbi:MAG: 16S rRNA (cytidine(1402)-2'-O)-methyltransferase [Burkholderiaceae bacterium]|nr:16S rRNA (cytidine(1402)-2'-O)-methyltransferase [Burkholderiaceae bacterium]
MQKHSLAPGLYVAATPLGHLADITDRVRQGLAQCDLLFAEDTRRAQSLLSALGIHRPKSSIRALHGHNEKEVIDDVLEALGQQQSVMLISDAGTPGISDPGSFLVNAAWQAGAHVTPLPGPSAVITALSVSGFVRWPMSFWGFAPAKPGPRRQWLASIHAARGIAVMFEAPHRAKDCLTDCAEIFGADTPMLFGREISKQHETLIRGSIHEVQTSIEALQQQDPGAAKGEMVWVFDLGDQPKVSMDVAQVGRWAELLIHEMSAATAAKCLMKMAGISRDEAYQAVLKAQKA